MNTLAQSAKQNKFTPTTNTSNLLVQRKCACGSTSKLSGQCSECEKKKLAGSNVPLIQPKLKIGQPNDKYEQEADRVADQVMAMSPNTNISSTPPRIQRLTGQVTGGVDTTAPTSVDRVLASCGRPMDSALQQDMGQRFGYDFSHVRIHTDTVAEQSARDVRAHAYTTGHNIVFGAGQFSPRTSNSHRLLAHELTHVVQQSEIRTPLLQGFMPELGGALVGAAVGAKAFAGGGVKGVVAGVITGGIVGGLAGHFLSELSGGNEEEIDKTEPKDEGISVTDPDFWKIWEKNIVEGSDLLESGGCLFPHGLAWKYDDRYWEKVDDPHYAAFKPKGVSPAKAIDELFNNPDLWELDCALHPEAVQLYAYRRTLGAARFNEKFKDLILRQHRSKGLKTEFKRVEDIGKASFNTIWNNAPVGTKVMWTNRSSSTHGTAWNHENGIKRSKGSTWQKDRYDAHPLGTNKRETEVKKEFAKNAVDYPASGTISEKQKYVDDKIYRHQLHLIIRS